MNEVMAQPNNGTAVVNVPDNENIVNVVALKQRANSVRQVKREIMIDGTHYGTVPGCGDKPTLLKNGAELLCMAFRLAPSVDIKITDMGNGHREYTVTTILSVIGTGEMVASGVGSCSTMESKYRYRGNELEATGEPVPKGYWDTKKQNPAEAQKMLGGNGFVARKDGDGKWMIYKKGLKQENPDIADTYNTVLKMASKRSLIDAVLKATGGSCEFTQDLEDYKIPETTEAEVVETTVHKAPPVNTEPQPSPEEKKKISMARFQTWAEDQKVRVGEAHYNITLNRFGGVEKVLSDVATKKQFIKDVESLPDAPKQETPTQEDLPF